MGIIVELCETAAETTIPKIKFTGKRKWITETS